MHERASTLSEICVTKVLKVPGLNWDCIPRKSYFTDTKPGPPSINGKRGYTFLFGTPAAIGKIESCENFKYDNVLLVGQLLVIYTVSTV